ncbi:DUF1697 domain-containing protein [Allopontixanthobacter sp.]|uniref:DUF1697 domain-containing protein n=1 Tax=Allopontixanthobacter sp. TaxID=2906452 RepID=UPI002AB97D11|nr:DUF1697 domain-containing protein [Allopontixanthobacter sp.]MDZ4308228.1 DUF1697 domain-containing protein [Allopontixanthobacter sp.]
MNQYVAFLGSINVGGNRLMMEDLRNALKYEDFEDVETVIASGNVLFRHDERPTPGLSQKIAFILKEEFDINSVVVVRSRDEVLAAIAENPFHGENDDKFVHVHWLEHQPTAEQFDDLITSFVGTTGTGRGGERLAAGTGALHIDFGQGVADSKLTAPFIERKLGTRGTARNLRSLKRIADKMDSSDG